MTSRLAPHEDPTSLGRILLDANIISARQLAEGCSLAYANDMMLGESLLSLGYLNESSLQSALELQGAQRARKPGERAARTIGLMQGATAQAASALDRLDGVLERANAVVRHFRTRRTTVKL